MAYPEIALVWASVICVWSESRGDEVQQMLLVPSATSLWPSPGPGAAVGPFLPQMPVVSPSFSAYDFPRI